MARDWRFRIASFRGAEFYVDQGGPSGGRRKVVHEYPGAEAWDVEDLGIKAGKVSLTAYFVSETSDADYARLVAAMNQPSPAELLIPFFPPAIASGESWEPHWSREQLNYVGVEICFIVENPAGAPVPIGLGERLIATRLAGAGSVLGDAISTLFAGTAATSWARADAVPHLADMVAFVETMRQDTPLPDRTSTAVAATLAALAPDAAGAADGDPGPFVTAALGAFDAIAIDADPDLSAAGFATAAALALALVPVQPASLVAIALPPSPADSIPAALAVAAALEAVRLVATATYADRQTAIVARDTIGTIVGAILPLLDGLGTAATDLVTDTWGQAVTYLSAVITDLAPIVLVELGTPLPSTALAYRLFGDPNRAAELVARNRVATPAIMPTLLEAASR